MPKYVFHSEQSWMQGITPTGLKKALRDARGPWCHVFDDQGNLIKVLDVSNLFLWFLQHDGLINVDATTNLSNHGLAILVRNRIRAHPKSLAGKLLISRVSKAVRS